MGNKQTNTYNINNTSADDVYKHIKQVHIYNTFHII